VPPNILVIVTDDQTASSISAMPAVRARLVDQGMKFHAAYSATPICGPSRASLLTGRWSHTTGAISTSRVLEEMRQVQDDTIATRLKGAGYRTGFFGKYNNGYDGPEIPPGWDRWFAMREPFNARKEYSFSSNGENRTFVRAEDNETDVLANIVELFIRNNTDNQPWFAYACPHDPHGPYYPAPRHEKMFKGETWDPKSERMDSGSTERADKPAAIRDQAPYTGEEERRNEQDYRGALRELQAVDDMVTRLLDVLQDTNQLDNTFVFFLTDNGYMFGEHGLSEKNLPYQEACRIPFVVRGPGVPRGTINNMLVSQVDLANTLCHIAVTDASGFDGRGLLNALRGNTPSEWRSRLLIEDVKAGWYSLRTTTHWYTEWDTGDRELYNMTTDEEQIESVHRDPANDALIAELHDALATLKTTSGIPHLRAEL
jgi:N-acetylglucosamine-6-sulfatase